MLFILAQSLLAQETKQILVGSLQSWYSEGGCEPETGRRHLVSDQQDGLRWPAQYKLQDTEVAKGLWIGTTDYTDAAQYGGNFYAHKVVHMGPRVADIEEEFIPIEFKMIGKYDHPVVTVNHDDASGLSIADNPDSIDAQLYCDRQIFNKVNTSIGVTMERTISAWTVQGNDNYFIYDYLFTNTGNVDSDPDIEQNKTLTGVYFFFQYRYAPTKEAGAYGGSWLPQSATWGGATLLDTRGTNPASGDPFRAVFSWLGKHSQWAGPGDNIGGPDFLTDGHLGAAQYMGTVVLHADKAAEDKTDDLSQPSTTQYIDSDAGITYNNSQFDASKMDDEYRAMSAGHPAQTMAEAVGEGYANGYGGSVGGYSNVQGFGPYTLEPGQSIHIVLAEAVAGLSREKGYEIGANWLHDNGPFKLPDGSTTTDRHEYKNKWVDTGQDSLFKTFEAAKDNFDSGYELPSAPRPPEVFEVYSSDDHFKLYWSDNAEADANFGGYAIYRTTGRYDTTFRKIFSCGLHTQNPGIVHYYEDHDVAAGTKYFYYISSFDNGNSTLGTTLYSSMFWTRTTMAATLADEPLIDADLYVNPAGDDSNNGLSASEPLKTISTASKRILTGELHPHTIYLADGVYNPKSNGETYPITLSGYVTLAGNDKSTTILDADKMSTILKVYGQNSVIKNLTLINGADSMYYGGGIHAQNASFKVENVRIIGNSAHSGGGVFLSASDVFFSGTSILNNASLNYGGGIYLSDQSSVTFDQTNRSSIYNNTSAHIGSDIYSVGDNKRQAIVLDTSTVTNPSDYYIFPSGKFSCDILHGVVEQTDADLYVAPEGNDSNSGLTSASPLKTITAALKQIKVDPDMPHTIFLSDGRYSHDTNAERFPLYLNSHVTLSGASSKGTTLDAQNENMVFDCQFHSDVHIKDMTVTKAAFRGIHIAHSSVSLENMFVEDNGGKGIECADSSSVTLSNVTIRRNANSGLYVPNMATVNFDPDRRCNIYYNTASTSNGKEIYNNGSRMDVILDTFTVKYPTELYAYPIDNYTFDILNGKIKQIEADLYIAPTGDDQNSGLSETDPFKTINHALDLIFADEKRPHTIFLDEGVYSASETGETFPLTGKDFVTIKGKTQGNAILDGEGQNQLLNITDKKNMTIENITIQNGNATYGGGLYSFGSDLTLKNIEFKYDSSRYGGALYIDKNSYIELSEISFTGNKAYYYGGAIYSKNADFSARHTLFNGNYAKTKGGAICLSRSNPQINTSTFYNNSTSHSSSGALYTDSNESNPVIMNSIFWNNGSKPIYMSNGNITLFHVDYEGGTDNIYTRGGTPDWVGSNIFSDPAFIGGDPFNFNLTENSPCVDAGAPLFVWNGDTLLNMDASEYKGNAPDLGAFESVFTDIFPPTPKELPRTCFLFQNYPNPFNPKTVFSYRVGTKGKSLVQVELSIFNILGQKVVTLVNKKQRAGNYKLEWDASGYSSGVYCFRLKTDQGFIQTRKCIVLK